MLTGCSLFPFYCVSKATLENQSLDQLRSWILTPKILWKKLFYKSWLFIARELAFKHYFWYNVSFLSDNKPVGVVPAVRYRLLVVEEKDLVYSKETKFGIGAAIYKCIKIPISLISLVLLNQDFSRIPGHRCEENPGGSPASEQYRLPEVHQPGHHWAAGDDDGCAAICRVRILSKSLITVHQA